MEILLAIIGGGVGTAIVGGLFSLIQWRLNRSAQKEDRDVNNQQAECAKRGTEITELHRMVGVLCLADRALLYDRIKHLAKVYIKRGSITVEELEDLKAMHAVYHDKDKLNGNGFLDDLMSVCTKELDVKVQ